MDFKTSIETCLLKKYKDFSGRASRSEYWYFFLFYFLVMILLNIAVAILPQTIGMLLMTVVMFGVILPSTAVAVRRLHDIDKSGWFLLLSLIPLINFVLLYFFVKKGSEGANRFGDPSL